MTPKTTSQTTQRLILAGVLGALLLFAGCTGTQTTDPGTDNNGADDATESDSATRTAAPVNWHPQSGDEGAVPDAEATLYTNPWGSSVLIESTGFVPGNVYTVWWVLFNEPESCEANPDPCGAGDIFADGNPSDAQVSFVVGNVADDDGAASFSAHLEPGPIDGWLPDPGFTNLWGAEHHFTINDHGPLLEEHMPDMMQSYRGGCSDDSPFPDIFPAAALADGEEGPNECRLHQSVAFQQ